MPIVPLGVRNSVEEATPPFDTVKKLRVPTTLKSDPAKFVLVPMVREELVTNSLVDELIWRFIRSPLYVLLMLTPRTVPEALPPMMVPPAPSPKNARVPVVDCGVLLTTERSE